jgi:hypothetical protein
MAPCNARPELTPPKIINFELFKLLGKNRSSRNYKSQEVFRRFSPHPLLVKSLPTSKRHGKVEEEHDESRIDTSRSRNGFSLFPVNGLETTSTNVVARSSGNFFLSVRKIGKNGITPLNLVCGFVSIK